MRQPTYTPRPLLLVSATIILQLGTAWILATVAAASPHPSLVLTITAVVGAIGLNLFRFVIWGYAHRRYPLSHTYPLTALFFPGVLALSYIHGDTISALQIGGTLLITLGALLLGSSSKKEGLAHG